MGTEINGIIIDGRVYVADSEYSQCRTACALGELCDKIDWDCSYSLCRILGADEVDDFGFRFSPELTEKLKEK